MSLAQLADKTHFSKGYLSNVESGRKPGTPEVATACGKALNASQSLLETFRQGEIAKQDATPWETAELLERLTASDVSPRALEALHSAVTELCCQYSYRDASELRTEAHGWIEHVGKLLRQPVGLKAHSELLTAAGWLALLVGCVEWDMGLKASGEYTRRTAQAIAEEAGNFEQLGWAYEMEAWYALTQERYPDVVKAAQAGQEMTKGTSVHVQLIGQEAKARGALGETEIPRLLETGRHFLDALPYPDRPDNHFKIDPAKLEFYEMDAYRLSGRDDMTKEYGELVVTQNKFPMRVTQARLALALVSAREGDLEASVSQAMDAITENRRSLPAFKLLNRQLAIELQQRFPGENLTNDFVEVVRSL
jgi:transcriptional regulator with XRE-family HTH domain